MDANSKRESESESKLAIYIDYRETLLIDELTELTELPIVSRNLEIGDIEISGQGIRLIFERKCKSDLASSIKDGRYKEQKSRMLSAVHPHFCTYILEANDPSGVSKSIMDSALVHTMYRDKMHIIHTNSVGDTAKFILVVFEKCVANPQYFTATFDNSNSDYVSLIKTKKKDNINKQTCYILQLSQIPGISYKIAKEIAQAYPSYMVFVESIKQCVNEKAQLALLKQINMIADKKAKVLLEYLL